VSAENYLGFNFFWMAEKKARKINPRKKRTWTYAYVLDILKPR
jgi:hypothetical protein